MKLRSLIGSGAGLCMLVVLLVVVCVTQTIRYGCSPFYTVKQEDQEAVVADLRRESDSLRGEICDAVAFADSLLGEGAGWQYFRPCSDSIAKLNGQLEWWDLLLQEATK